MSKIINIGLDLDNTLINYSKCFELSSKKLDLKINKFKDKDRLKNSLFQNGYKNKDWMKIQGLSYGVFISEYARIFLGVKRFLLRAKCKKSKLIILSHKTKKGHFIDTKINLREEALKFLNLNKIYTNNENSLIHDILFFDSIDEKISFINKNKFDFFIDDLENVLLNLDHHKTCLIKFEGTKFAYKKNKHKKFNVFENWFEIDEFVNGYINKTDVRTLLGNKIKIKRLENINQGGNSKTFKITSYNNKTFKLKFFNSNKKFNNLKNEVSASNFLNRHKINISEVIEVNHENNYVLFNWVKGKKITKPKLNDIKSFLGLIQRLYFLKKDQKKSYRNKASAACFSISDIEKQFIKRYLDLKNCSSENLKLQKFLELKLYPSFFNYIYWLKSKKDINSSIFNKINLSQSVISLSDFGLHNSVSSKGELYFFDFEYFGLDDPIKLISDFYYNPSNSLFSKYQKKYWIDNSLKIFDTNNDTLVRFKYHFPLYGFIWCLIILNDFKDDIWFRRTQANKKLIPQRKKILNKKYLNSIKQFNTVMKSISLLGYK